MEEKRAKFTSMENGTADDWSIIAESNINEASELPNKIIDHLMMLGNDYGGFAVDRLTHSIQTATRAYHDGRDEEYVVCALLHDIGDNLAPSNHADFAATLLEPFVSDKNYWIVKHHGIFQGYYFFEKYDQNSFDPNYECLPLEFFIPMVKKVFASPKKSIYKNSN